MTHVTIAGLEVAAPLHRLLVNEVLPPLGLAPEAYFGAFRGLLEALRERNMALLARREALQASIDAWWTERRERVVDAAEQRAFLEEIGYLLPPPAPFAIGTANVDAEIALTAGPQLVVPLSNARYALNAANARWGSLYDALYGTDALGSAPPPGGYNATRGAEVIARAKQLLDRAMPLAALSHAEVTRYEVRDGRLVARTAQGAGALAAGVELVGWRGAAEAPTHIVTRHHGLHVELVIDPAHPVGAADPAGVADVVMESALTTIMDLEDSVAAVDGADKAAVYANWLGLMRGDLAERFDKGGRTVERTLGPDREYSAPGGGTVSLPGRSLMFVRNVGHLMRNDAVRLDGEDAFEGQVDAVVTSTIALFDLKRLGAFRNSRTGSVYIVKPKMHGPDEVAFAGALFDAVEDMLGLSRHTLKIGVMDEERRTTLNLARCVEAVRDRIVFINTGFLDRTGDEIHTAMQAGPMIRKEAMRGSAWLKAYEDNNVDVGLGAGFRGRAQIGKGMWAAPDRMADMLAQKAGHPKAGANAAWVPSPTAATLHATHYHEVDVAAVQAALAAAGPREVGGLLETPVARGHNWSTEEVAEELANNAQGILGYVVRWVEQGVGCSKVPDIRDIGLMEDRATLRISSQHIANWLLHGVASADLVEATLRRMAEVVDRQNDGDPAYRPMAPDFEGSAAFQAARALVFEGVAQPSGYTEPLLHAARRRLKTAG